MRKLLLVLGLLFLFYDISFAQAKIITGKIMNQQGRTVPFASVRLKGTRQGVAADAEGIFSIKAKTGDVLVVSGSDVTQTEVTVGSDNQLNITVAEKVGNLSEVVVTALGQSQSKAKLGYSTTSFNTATINKNGAVGALDGLEGKVAGADISSIGGPGSSTKVVLRSFGVIAGGNNQPLYVIDGVPLSDAQFQQGTGGVDGADFGNGMNNINPNDIETINILKGTAASSLYGGLAKNGVIMITTKKGKAGKLKIEYSGSANFSRVGKLPDYQTEFGQGWGGLFVSGENGSWGPKLDGQERLWGSVVDNSQLEKPFSFIKNNLRNFFNTGSEYNNTLSLSGGTDVTRFYFSYGNVTSNGIIPNKSNFQERNTFSLRTNSNFDNFSINTSFNYVNQGLKVPSTGYGSSSGGGVYNSLLQIPVDIPITDFKDYKNKFFDVNNYFTPYAENPYFALYENGDKQSLDRFFGNVDLGYKFSPHFSAELRIGADFTDARTFIWKQPDSAQPNSWRSTKGNNPTNPEGATTIPDIGEVSQGSDFFGLINSDFILKYNNELSKDFTVDALVGANYYHTSQRSENTTVTNLIVPSFFNLSNTSKPPVATDNSFYRTRMGLYGQVVLGFKDQLFLTGNIRNDWSSTLPIAQNAIFYPGASVSWLASQLFDSRTTVSYLKFRAAYGKTGSDPAPYQVLPQLGSGTIGLPLGSLTFPFNGVGAFGINTTIGNPTLKPIFTNELEVGAEARFFHDRIGLDVTLYDKITNGQIFPVPIAPSTGYFNLVENLGKISNKGIELTFNAKPVESRDFTWNFTYVFAKNWNKVVSLTGSQDPLLASIFDTELRAVVGKSVASIYTIVPERSPSGQIVVNPVSGLPLPNTAPLDSNGLSKGYIGSGLYDFTMGLTNTFTYKNFSLGFSLDFRYGGVMYSETANILLFDGNAKATTYNDRRPFIVPNSVVATTDGSGKTVYTPNTAYVGSSSITPGGSLNETDQTYNYYGEGSSFTGGSDAMRIIDRSFLKLRDINLSYSFPSSLVSKLKLKGASFGIYGRNFLLWTPKSNMYVDPEATNLGNDLTGVLGEFEGTPLTKNYGVTLKVTF